MLLYVDDSSHSSSDTDDGLREDLSSSSTNDDALMSIATPAEKYLHGLLLGKGHSRKNVCIREVEGRGHSAFANRDFDSGEFVCEYASTVRVRQTPDIYDERNEELNIGCYCLDASYKGTIYTFDATSKLKDPGRYINHASKNYNLNIMKPVMVGKPPNNRLRIGFLARKPIKKGEELFFDYGVKDPDLPWLTTDAKQVSTTISALKTSSSVPPKKWTNRRTRNDCPITQCGTKDLLKLSNHLKKVHGVIDSGERKKWLQTAKQVSTIEILLLDQNYTTAICSSYLLILNTEST